MKVKRLNYNWSDKHIEYMRNSQKACYNIAEGSIRSGKTTDNVFAFAYDIKHSKDKIHLATASTQPAAKLIIGDCDGYGLEHIFRGQCRWGKYKGNECLIIKGPDTHNKEKIILFCGGAKADSYKKFRGFTIGLWIATEINLHHDNTIQEALKRQIKADIKRLYWDLNPSSPGDPIYRDYIDKWQKLSDEGKLLGGYNYRAFNIFDNINIPEKNLKEVLSRYEIDSVFYKRDILGIRAVAEGLIYKHFAENVSKYTISKDKLPKYFTDINIGVDFGGNGSQHAFCCTGIYNNTVYALKSKSIKATGTDVIQLITEFILFADNCTKEYGRIDGVYCDCAEQTIINTFRVKTNYKIYNSIKNPIIDRIRATSLLISSDRFFVVEKENVSLIDGLCNAVWDIKYETEDKRLDNGTSNIDILDSFEYSWEYNIRRLIK